MTMHYMCSPKKLQYNLLLYWCFSVMSFPAEGVESAFKNHIDEVRNYLESRHRNCYAVYNLSQRSYRATKFENRVRRLFD